jgi:hypothetical protein
MANFTDKPQSRAEQIGIAQPVAYIGANAMRVRRLGMSDRRACFVEGDSAMAAAAFEDWVHRAAGYRGSPGQAKVGPITEQLTRHATSTNGDRHGHDA